MVGTGFAWLARLPRAMIETGLAGLRSSRNQT